LLLLSVGLVYGVVGAGVVCIHIAVEALWLFSWTSLVHA